MNYTETDMEAAFYAGGANAAKLRVSGNKLTLPVLEFKEWLEKRTTKTEQQRAQQLKAMCTGPKDGTCCQSSSHCPDGHLPW